MDYPVFSNGEELGVLRVRSVETDMCFELSGMPSGLYRVWVEGEQGRLLLGLMENGRLRRRFSPNITRPIGRPICAKMERLTLAQVPWRIVRTDEFTGWALPDGAYCRKNGQWYELALSYTENRSFPLLPIFCFAKVAIIENRQYLIFSFDSEWHPVMAAK